MSNMVPAWVDRHRNYYGSRFKMAHYMEWNELLHKKMEIPTEILDRAVGEMITSGFKGYVEDHLNYLKAYVCKELPKCPRCEGRGLVTVDNRGPRAAELPKISVLCPCPRGSSHRSRYPNGLTLEQYEAKHGPVIQATQQRELYGDSSTQGSRVRSGV